MLPIIPIPFLVPIQYLFFPLKTDFGHYPSKPQRLGPPTLRERSDRQVPRGGRGYGNRPRDARFQGFLERQGHYGGHEDYGGHEHYESYEDYGPVHPLMQGIPLYQAGFMMAALPLLALPFLALGGLLGKLN